MITPSLTKTEQIALADFIGREREAYRAALAADGWAPTAVDALLRRIDSAHRKTLFAIAGDTRARHPRWAWKMPDGTFEEWK